MANPRFYCERLALAIEFADRALLPKPNLGRASASTIRHAEDNAFKLVSHTSATMASHLSQCEQCREARETLTQKWATLNLWLVEHKVPTARRVNSIDFTRRIEHRRLKQLKRNVMKLLRHLEADDTKRQEEAEYDRTLFESCFKSSAR